MRRSFAMTVVLLAFVFASTAAWAGMEPPTKEDPVPGWLKVGTQLVYGVDFHGTQYDFIITIRSMDSGLTFDWEMTSPVNTSGTVEMSAAALETATGQNNYFSGGTLKLDDKTSVWVSKAVHKALSDEKSIDIVPETDAQTLTFQGREKWETVVDGKAETLDVIFATTAAGQKFWIWSNPSHPIIFEMQLQWTVKLKEIKSSCTEEKDVPTRTDVE